MLIKAAGFITVIAASAFLDGNEWVGALIACAVGAAMLWGAIIADRIRRKEEVNSEA